MRCSPVAEAARTSTSTVLRSHTNVHAHSGTPLMLSCPTSFLEIFPVAPSLQLHHDDLLALSPNVQRAKNCVLPPPRGVSFHLLVIHNIFGWYGEMWLPFWAVFLSITIAGATDTKITDITQVLDELPTCLVWFLLAISGSYDCAPLLTLSGTMLFFSGWGGLGRWLDSCGLLQ